MLTQQFAAAVIALSFTHVTIHALPPSSGRVDARSNPDAAGCQITLQMQMQPQSQQNGVAGTDIPVLSVSFIRSLDRGGKTTNWSWGGTNSGSTTGNQTTAKSQLTAKSDTECAPESKYEIGLKRGTQTKTVTYPADGSYTSNKEIKLGDVSGQFR